MKVKIAQCESSRFWYADKIGEAFEVEESLVYNGEWYRLLGEYGEGARLLRVADVVQEAAKTETTPIFSVGDKVKIVRKVEQGDPCKRHFGWSKLMDNTVGTTAIIIGDAFDEYGTYQLDNGWYYLPKSLELVESAQAKDVTWEMANGSSITFETEQPKRNKYMREVKKGVWVDVYDVLRAWEVTDPCLQHLLKKALAGGQRGHKDLGEDLRDILASAKRAVEMHEEWEQKSI